MDFQNANIKNIFRIISEVSGFNLVLSPTVSGTVNIRLIDVPWNKAFELILENWKELQAKGRIEKKLSTQIGEYLEKTISTISELYKMDTL